MITFFRLKVQYKNRILRHYLSRFLKKKYIDILNKIFIGCDNFLITYNMYSKNCSILKLIIKII